MEKTIDTLQPIIIEAKNDLSRETREAIDSVNWKLTILEMAGKYNQDQLDTLETETELVLCGILSPEVYQTELQNRMMLTKEQVSLLLEEMDKLIFKKIQGELEKKISSKEETSSKQEVESSKDNSSSMEEVVSSKEVEDEVPKPPYGISSMQQVESSKDNSSRMQEVASSKEENATQTTKTDFFEDKLKGSVTGGSNVSEYNSNKTDPYREPF